MKASIFLLAGAAALLAACSGEHSASGHSGETHASADGDAHSGHKMGPSPEAAKKKREYVAMLVKHFDAQGCLESELIGTMRRSEPDGSGMDNRAYQTNVACADEMEGILLARGFSQSEGGVFVSASADGTTETVTIRKADDGSRAGVEWEVERQ